MNKILNNMVFFLILCSIFFFKECLNNIKLPDLEHYLELF